MKKIELGRRGRIRVFSFGAALVTVLSGLAYAGWHQAATYERYIEHDYQNAFMNMSDSVTNIDVALQKGVYTRSPSMLAAIASQVTREAAVAQSAMASIPFSLEELDKTARFLSQVGDYTYFVSKQAAGGHRFSDDVYENMEHLSKTAGQLALELNSVQAIMNEENLDLDTMLIKGGDAPDSDSVSAAGGLFKNMESEFPESPSLIYDGPFSEHLDKKTAVFLEGQPDISLDKATQKAAAFLGIEAGILQADGEAAGTIPSFCFSGQVDGGQVSIDLSKQGGYVIYLVSSRKCDEAQMTTDEAVQKAHTFLRGLGFDNMHVSYWERFDNNLLVNFAYEQDNVVCYSDLIKVGVAMDTGKVTGFEARGYLMSHKRRSIPEVRVSKEEAKKRVAPSLKQLGHKMTLIPSEGQKEVFCHEFTCQTPDGRHLMVYINAETGNEEKILLLIESENGTLTM